MSEKRSDSLNEPVWEHLEIFLARKWDEFYFESSEKWIILIFRTGIAVGYIKLFPFEIFKPAHFKPAHFVPSFFVPHIFEFVYKIVFRNHRRK